MELNATQAQVLIWETALETAEKYDAATGDVAVRDEALAAQINAISYLDWINAAPGHFLASIDTTGWFVAQSDLSQDFLVYQPPVSVPEPATMLLLGVGLLGLAGFGRNTKRR